MPFIPITPIAIKEARALLPVGATCHAGLSPQLGGGILTGLLPMVVQVNTPTRLVLHYTAQGGQPWPTRLHDPGNVHVVLPWKGTSARLHADWLDLYEAYHGDGHRILLRLFDVKAADGTPTVHRLIEELT